jgi:hypothetical protein
MRGADRGRHERAVGCGGRVSCDGRAWLKRTAKSCGLGARRGRQAREKHASQRHGGKRARLTGENAK